MFSASSGIDGGIVYLTGRPRGRLPPAARRALSCMTALERIRFVAAPRAPCA